MRKVIPLIMATLLLCTACKQKKDKLVAEVYYHKLYQSEIKKNMPTGLSTEDSVKLVNDYINQWIREQLLLHKAEELLSIREKDFSQKMDEYRNNLLINALFDKITAGIVVDSLLEEEMNNFNRRYDNSYAVKKPIIQLNYIKLSKGSVILPKVKAILFDEQRRVSGKDTLTTLLGDSVEYMLDDEQWLYVDEIEREVSIPITTEMVKKHTPIEQEANGYHYLIVLLNFKDQRSVSETGEEQAAVQMMLMNQRRQQYIETYIDSLYEDALKKGLIIQ